MFMICTIQPVVRVPICIARSEAEKDYQGKENYHCQLSKSAKRKLTVKIFRQQCTFHDVGFHMCCTLYSKTSNLNDIGSVYVHQTILSTPLTTWER